LSLAAGRLTTLAFLAETLSAKVFSRFTGTVDSISAFNGPSLKPLFEPVIEKRFAMKSPEGLRKNL